MLERSVFDPLPGAGRWGSALLLDGNLGIGGDPVRLLRRVAGLVRAGGLVVVELDAPGRSAGPKAVRLEVRGRTGPWFLWARVGADELPALAGDAGLAVDARWSTGPRWFAALRAAR